nr:Qnr family pentapeptide repeat protein [Photobacterium aphoticum]
MMITHQTYEGVSFAKQNLSGEVYQHCRFYVCDFSRADLTDTQFIDCQFIARGDIEGCCFAYTQLKEVSFKQCDLSMADFRGADCFGIEFRSCNLKGANFVQASFANYITHQTFFCSAYISDCNLSYTNLENQQLEECELFENRWNGANLQGATLKGADLSRGEFSPEQWGQFAMEGCNLCHVDLTGLDPRLVPLKGVMICDWQQEQLLESFGLVVIPG